MPVLYNVKNTVCKAAINWKLTVDNKTITFLFLFAEHWTFEYYALIRTKQWLLDD